MQNTIRPPKGLAFVVHKRHMLDIQQEDVKQFIQYYFLSLSSLSYIINDIEERNKYKKNIIIQNCFKDIVQIVFLFIKNTCNYKYKIQALKVNSTTIGGNGNGFRQVL